MDHETFQRQRTELADAFAALRDWPPVAEHASAIQELLQDARRDALPADRALVICLCGSTGAGKSALLNALAGQAIAEEGVDRPTTTQLTIYAPPDPALDFLTLPADKFHIVSDPRAPADKVLIDAPDMNSTSESNRQLLAQALGDADLVIVVAYRQSVVERDPLDFLKPYVPRKHMVFVLNRIDELLAENVEPLIEQWLDDCIRGSLGIADPRCFRTAAIHAQLWRADADPTKQGEVAELRGFITDEIDAVRARQIRQSNAAGALRQAASRLTSSVEPWLPKLEDGIGRLERTIDALSNQVREEALDALDSTRRGLRRALLGATAPRLAIPFGIAARCWSFVAAAGASTTRLLRIDARDPASGADASGAWFEVAARRIRQTLEERLVALRAVHRDAAAGDDGLTEESAEKVAGELREQLAQISVDSMEHGLAEQARAFASGPRQVAYNLLPVALIAYIAWQLVASYFKLSSLPTDFLWHSVALFVLMMGLELVVLRWELQRCVSKNILRPAAQQITDLHTSFFDETLDGFVALAAEAKRPPALLAELERA